MHEISRNDTDTNTNDLALFGDGILAYIKQISAADAKIIIGDAGEVPQDIEFFCLYSANGTPLAISDSHTSAFESALSNDLRPVHLN